jgi:hypothetical protein
MKISHLLARFGVVFVGSTIMTNVFFHSMGWDNNYNNVDLGSLSIYSAKELFILGSNGNNNNKNGNKGTGKISDESIGNEDVPKDVVALKLVQEPYNAKPAAETASSPEENETVRPIELLLPQEEIDWIRRRNQTYWEFYIRDDEKKRRDRRWSNAINDPNRHDINETTGFTNYNEDTEGPWMDFLIAGHPKTGTTTLVANLAKIAPMKVKDFCSSKPASLLHYLLDQWPKRFPEIMDGPNKYIPDSSLHLVGSKCPQFIGSPEFISRYTQAHPRMKLIVGIRHPVEWLVSFVRMGHSGDLYKRMKLCPHYETIDPLSGIPGGISSDRSRHKEDHEQCINECRCKSPICFHRSRLHIGLARIGKTPLSPTERELLAPGDLDGGENLFNGKAQNPIFIYDQSQMKQDSYWDELASFLGLSYIPNVHYHSSHGGHNNITLCTPFHDEFRSKMMEHSYNMSVWLEDYLLPVGLDPTRPDVVIANTTSFREIIQTYKTDPCERLVRNNVDGTYFLDPSLRVGALETFEIHTTEFKSCRAAYPDRPKEENKQKQLKVEKNKQEAERQNPKTERRGNDNNGDGNSNKNIGRLKKEKRLLREDRRKIKRGDVGEHQRRVDEAIVKAVEAKRRFEAS